MAVKVFSFFALVACVAVMAEAKPQLLAAPVVAAVAPVTTVSHTAALSAHPLPGTPFISGYSHQAIRHISRSAALVAAPVVHAAPYVASPYHLASPYSAAYYY